MKVCGACGAPPGENHVSGCSVERCTQCGDQAVSCSCDSDSGIRMPWSGEWPGVAECREYGFWSVFGPGLNPPQPGWMSVPEGTPGARENLNRLYRDCQWDAVQQKWVQSPLKA